MTQTLTKNFKLQEFVSQSIWEKWGEKAIWFIDKRIVLSAQALRDNLGVPLTINSWSYGGDRQESGLRVEGMTNWRPFSQHSFGRAIDIVSSRMTADEMRAHIIQNREKYPFITAIELNVSWLHIDCRETNSNDFLLFNP